MTESMTMTDAELLELLLAKQICTGFQPDGYGGTEIIYGPDLVTVEAADRIEALTAQLESTLQDRKLILGERDRTFSLMLTRTEAAEAERDRLREALLDHNDLLRSAIAIAEREGVRGEIASTNWDAYYNRAAVVLKRHHQITTDARAALKGESHE